MKRLLAAALFVALASTFVAPASAQTPPLSGGAVQNMGLCSAVTATYPLPCAPTIGDKPFYSAATTSLTQFIAAPTGGQSIRFTFVGYSAIESATGGELEIESGTGSNCASGTAVVAPLAWVPTTQVSGSYGWAEGAVYILPANSAACVVVSAGTVTFAAIAGTYAIY